MRPEWRSAIPEVVHRDGSARLQTVHRASNPLYHALLREFGAIAGIPILINTSFNRRGMPIVETPREAVSFFLECELDVLAIEGRVVRKARARDERPPRKLDAAGPAGASADLVSGRARRPR